jgi:hypothetical protein
VVDVDGFYGWLMDGVGVGPSVSMMAARRGCVLLDPKGFRIFWIFLDPKGFRIFWIQKVFVSFGSNSYLLDKVFVSFLPAISPLSFPSHL